MNNQAGGVMIVPERDSELESIKDILRHIKEQVDYNTKLLETLVSALDLSHKSKTDMSDILKLNSEMLASVMGDKNFQGKEQLLNIVEKLSNIGSK